MYLIYIDESGNTGCNLNDRQQPVFVLCSLVVEMNGWQRLESDLQSVAREFFEGALPIDFEVKGEYLRNGTGSFRGYAPARRIGFRDRWLDVAAAHGLKIIYRAIEKARFQKWIEQTFGEGVRINPHVAAFALVAVVVDQFLSEMDGQPHGIFISDENVEVAPDVEKSVRVLRGTDGTLRLNQIIEKGFFIPSEKSLPLQLCDVCAYSLRKQEEQRLGRPAKSIDASGIDKVQPLIHRGNEKLMDVVRWLTEERKKGATKD